MDRFPDECFTVPVRRMLACTTMRPSLGSEEDSRFLTTNGTLRARLRLHKERLQSSASCPYELKGLQAPGSLDSLQQKAKILPVCLPPTSLPKISRGSASPRASLSPRCYQRPNASSSEAWAQTGLARASSGRQRGQWGSRALPRESYQTHRHPLGRSGLESLQRCGPLAVW